MKTKRKPVVAWVITDTDGGDWHFETRTEAKVAMADAIRFNPGREVRIVKLVEHDPRKARLSNDRLKHIDALSEIASRARLDLEHLAGGGTAKWAQEAVERFDIASRILARNWTRAVERYRGRK